MRLKYGPLNRYFIAEADCQKPQFKRLKRGHRDDDRKTSHGVNDIFDSDEDEDMQDRRDNEGRVNEFEDFIEEDEFSDEERQQAEDDHEVARTQRRKGGAFGLNDASGLDETAREDLVAAFGNGEEYAFALDAEMAEEEDDAEEQKVPKLTDVFEPAQLAEKMMTDEDNEIRQVDEPERFQIARKPYKHIVLTDEQTIQESAFIASLLLPKKPFAGSSLSEPFQKAIGKVLEFMISDLYEVPYIFQHRRDYLIHSVRTPMSPDPLNPNAAEEFEVRAEKLLNQDDLWTITELDLRYRAIIDKRNALQRNYDNLRSVSDIKDDIFEDMLPAAVTMEELQDVQDYLQFQYSSQLRDYSLLKGKEVNGQQKRAGTAKTMFERIRNGKVYSLVRAFGLTADAFAQNVLKQGKRQYTDDPTERPDDMADSPDILDGDFTTGSQALRAAKAMFVEELSMSPKMRKALRGAYYMQGVIECYRTDKGLKKIDEQHPYYEFKYLRNQQLMDIARQPEMFLKMLQAEEEGLVDVKVRIQNLDSFKRQLYKEIESDNFSDVADVWNKARREVVDMALSKLEKTMVRGVKENFKNECETAVGLTVRTEALKRFDQAPYKPKGMVLGTVPRVLTLSNGGGGREAICWAWVEEDGRVLENGKFTDIGLGDSERGIADGVDVAKFVELVERRKPDVIGVSGWSTETRKLFEQLQDLVDRKDLRGAEYETEDGRDRSDPLEVVIVNDEIARLYQTSDRGAVEHPGFAPLTRYCVALAKYLQSPLKEYAALGRDIISITFDPSQQLLPPEKMLKQIESAMIDIVNLCGVDINEAVSDMSVANLLPYVCGLGPRKATSVIKAINLNGGYVATRAELAGDPDENKIAAVGPKVWDNCSSFLTIDYDSAEPNAEYLDNTRVHPEDYELGRKMAADALELDEEDIKAEVDEGGDGAVVRKLVRDDAQEKVNDLILEEYAEQLEKNFHQRKRTTLETIRAELQNPYEELRRNFTLLSSEEIFTMFTGETKETLTEGMIVPMAIKRVREDSIEGKLDCGIDTAVSAQDITDRMDVPIRSLYQPHMTVQGKILYINRKRLHATVSLLQDALSRPYRKHIDRIDEEWDYKQEEQDREAMQEKNDVSGRTQRVVKHPLFRSFNAAQAEEYLGSQNRGDVVIRPSSKGLDHLAVTWKVSDGVYQHIDVLELDKENEFSVGRTLKVGGRYTYSDLDELIVLHVKAMAKKVDEICGHEKYQETSKADLGTYSFNPIPPPPRSRIFLLTPFFSKTNKLTKSSTERWLTTYTEANPKRSVYGFCINPKAPGYFYLCFKAGISASVMHWAVKIIPGAFELLRNPYPDMRALCNGFKTLFMNMQTGKRR